MKSELVIAGIMLVAVVICFSALVIYRNEKKETRGCVAGLGREKSFCKTDISETLKVCMSYAMFVFSFADLFVTNSGPNTCESRKITIRHFGDDEMIMQEEEARFS